MTSVIRYVRHTIDGGSTPAIASVGSDFQLIAFDIYLADGINADASADVLTWTGSGKIKSIASLILRRTGSNREDSDTGEIIPLGAVDDTTHTRFKIDATGRTIKCSIPADSVVIPQYTTLSLLLVIGND